MTLGLATIVLVIAASLVLNALSASAYNRHVTAAADALEQMLDERTATGGSVANSRVPTPGTG